MQKKYRYMTALIIGLLGAGSFQVFAASHNKRGHENIKTVEACTRLLPKGHKYDLKIAMTINTAEKQHQANAATPYVISDGNFSLTDHALSSNVSQGDKDQVKPFVNCVKRLFLNKKDNNAFNAALSGDSQLEKSLHKLNQTPEHIAKLMQRYYNHAAVEAAQVMADVQMNTNSIAGVLRNGYQQSAERAVSILKQVGETAAQTRQALQQVYHESKGNAESLVHKIYNA